MKLFYRNYLDASYRFIDVSCDGIKVNALAIKRYLYYSDDDLDNYNIHKQFYYRNVNTYRVVCFYPKELEEEAIQFCKVTLQDSIENEVMKLHKKIDIIKNSKNKVTKQTSMQEIYRVLRIEDKAGMYDDILGCED